MADASSVDQAAFRGKDRGGGQNVSAGKLQQPAYEIERPEGKVQIDARIQCIHSEVRDRLQGRSDRAEGQSNQEIRDENKAHTVVDTIYNPPIDGVSGVTMLSDATYISACPAGMPTGSELMADGTFVQRPAQ